MKYIIFSGYSDDIVKLVPELVHDELSFTYLADDSKVAIMYPDVADTNKAVLRFKQYGLLHHYELEKLNNMAEFEEFLRGLYEEEKH